MKTMIIYDSFFGNTEKVAKTISQTLNNATVYNVKNFDMNKLKNIDILIVGSPTRAFSPSENIKNFLKQIPNNQLKDTKVTSFDTRANLKTINSALLKFLVKTFGYASEPILKKLKQKGGQPILKPEGFLVEDTEGPLTEGELKRAKQWVEEIK